MIIDWYQRRTEQLNAEARRRANLAQNFDAQMQGWDDDDEDIQMERVREPTPQPHHNSEHLNPLLDPRLWQDSFV